MTEQTENDPGPLGLRGVEIMAAFIDNLDSNELVFDLIENIAIEEGAVGLSRTATGLSLVSAYLLVRLAKSTGVTEREILQAMAQYYAAQ
jgi:hypothetical protein